MRRINFHSETELIKNLRKGDPLAFEAIYLKYHNKLYQFALAYLKSETIAEGIVHDVFMKLWDKKETLKTETSFKSFLFTITLNFIKKSFRHKAIKDKYKHHLLNEFSESDDSYETRLNYQEIFKKLDILICQLPEKRKLIFTERKLNEKPVKQIAEELNISPKTVENQITKAIHFLKEGLKKDLFKVILVFSFLFTS